MRWLSSSYRSKSKTNKKLLWDIVNRHKEGGCIYCGETHLQKLQFHHKNPKEKLTDIATLVYCNAKLKYVLDELNKCVVVCDSCHKKLHNKEN